jgi:hypothetical protein
MTEYGFEIAQRGVDIQKAAEWQKVASSKWAYLPIKAQGYFSLGDAQDFGDHATIFEHDFGYLSPFLIFVRERGAGWTIDRFKNIYNDPTRLYAANGFAAYDCYWVLFDYNLDQPPPQDFGKSGSFDHTGSNDEGIKALQTDAYVRPGEIESQDYRDFSFNTGAKNMSVHLAGSQTISNSGSSDPNDYIIHIHHNLGYLATYLGFQYNDSTTNVPGSIQTLNNVVTDDTNILSIRGAQAVLIGKIYYIILKEPFALAL